MQPGDGRQAVVPPLAALPDSGCSACCDKPSCSRRPRCAASTSHLKLEGKIEAPLRRNGGANRLFWGREAERSSCADLVTGGCCGLVPGDRQMIGFRFRVSWEGAEQRRSLGLLLAATLSPEPPWLIVGHPCQKREMSGQRQRGDT